MGESDVAARDQGEGVGRAGKSRTVRGKASAGMRPAQQDMAEGRKMPGPVPTRIGKK